MAFCRFVNFGISKLIPARNLISCKETLTVIGTRYSLTNERYFRKAYAQISKAMKVRRKVAGPERLRRRNEWDNWNYKAELYAFSRRLHENISEDTLRCAFIHDSYLQEEEERRRKLDNLTENVQLDLKSNASLIALGHDVTKNYLNQYLTHSFPKLPEEGINALHNYLMSEEVLSHISFNIGTSDLIFSAEYPPEKPTLTDSLKAIIGSIATDDSVKRAENFVLDFVCPQLVSKDVFEIWELENPLGVLNAILEKQGIAECEPRLIFESGQNTIEAVYHVGLYSDKVFIGRGPGETLAIATEMAAYDTLRKLFGLRDCEKPLNFGEKARAIDLKSEKKLSAISDWSSEALKVNPTL